MIYVELQILVTIVVERERSCEDTRKASLHKLLLGQVIDSYLYVFSPLVVIDISVVVAVPVGSGVGIVRIS